TEDAPSVMRAAPGLPPALGAAIDKCLARDPAARFAGGEALADALAPTAETRPALPTPLRAWLVARNPLLVPYLGWPTLFSVLTAGNIYGVVTHNPGSGFGDVATLAFLAMSPLLPIIGFHLNQAHKQFKAGYSLADLRQALAIGQRERGETDALALNKEEPP